MENACNQILQLWAQMRDNSNPALAQNASGQFSQILSSPDLIYPLISIVENIKEEGIQLYATNFIYIWTKNHFLEADKEKLAQFYQNILQIACTIQTPNYRENICQAALLIESHIKLSPQPFFDLMNTFFQSQNTIGTGFFLASLLLPLYEEIFITIPDFFIKVISVAAQLLSADTTDTINNVYKFLITFFRFPDLAKQFFDQLSFISEGIHKRFQYLFNVNQNPNEISIFFRMICRSIKCLPEFVHTFLVDLFQVTIPLLLNNQLDPMIRISAFTIFEYAAEYDVSLLAGNIEDYIKHFTEFSLVLCRESPETNEYEAPANFFELVSNELDEETVISLFVPIIEMLTNSNDPFSYLVSIMIIDSIFVSIEAEVLDIFDIFEQLVGKSLVSGNKVLIDKSCQLIDKFISTDESLSAQIIDIFEGFLLQVIPISDNAITTLTNLYDNSSKEPKNIEQTLSIIYEQFKSSSDPYRIEILCQLIAQIVLTISDIQPQYYQAIQPYLSQLIKMGESSYAVAIQTYCSFAHSNPLLLRNDLESLCTIIFNGLSNPNNHNLILKCSTSLQILIENYTITISPFINQFLSRYIQLFNEETPDFSEGKDLDDNEQYNEYLKVLAIYTEMKGQILLTITTIFNYYIDQFASQYLAIKNLLQVSITNEEIKNYAIRSFSEVISGFNKANIDSTELIQIFLSQINEVESTEELIDIWNTMVLIISNSNKQLLLQCGNIIVEQIVIGLKLENQFYKESKKKNLLNRYIVTPLMTSIMRFFLEIGYDGKQYVETILALVLNIANTKSKYCKGPSYRTISFLLTIFPEYKNNLFEVALTQNILMIKSSYTDNRSCSFDSINYLLNVEPNLIVQCLQVINESLNEVINNESHYPNGMIDSAVMLWCSIVMIYQLQPQENEFDNILQLLNTTSNCINVKFIAKFLRFACEKWPMKFNAENMFEFAAGFFASDDYVIRATDKQDMDFLAQFIVNASIMDFQRFGFNEYRISMIQKHLGIYKQ